MALTALEQLEHLSDKIRDEEMSIFIVHSADIFLGKATKAESPLTIRERTENEMVATLLLRTLRIHLCLELQHREPKVCREYFRQDWDKAVECVEFLMIDNSDKQLMLSVTADLILLVDPQKRKALLHMLELGIRLKVKPLGPIERLMLDIAKRMGIYCLQTQRMELAMALFANLISLSRERNREHPAIHRAIVTCALFYTVDADPALTARICREQEDCFRDIRDTTACNFYYFYGFSLMNTQNTQEAIPLLKKCHGLFLNQKGDTNWRGMRAGAIEYINRLFTAPDPEAEAWLWDTLKKIDEGYYPDADSTREYVAIQILGALLRTHMDQKNMKGMLPHMERYLAYCQDHVQDNTTPNMTVRYAYNLLASYYLENKEPLQAVHYIKKALASPPPEGVEAVPSDVLLYTNLLFIYTNLNDEEQIIHYANILEEIREDYENDAYTSQQINTMLKFAESRFIMEEPETDNRKEIYDFYQRLRSGTYRPDRFFENNKKQAVYLITLCEALLASWEATPEDLEVMRYLADYFLEHRERYFYSDAHLFGCHSVLAQVAWQMGSGEAPAHVDRAVACLDALPASQEHVIMVRRLAAVIYHAYGKTNRAIALVEQVLGGITTAWQEATAYLNDRRVCELMAMIGMQFDACYGICHTTQPAQKLYDMVLRFKDLPSLVGRERNKFLRLTPVDLQLQEQILQLQDQLAQAQMQDSLVGSDTTEQLTRQLEQLEARFARLFPKELQFTPISFDRVKQKLPEGSAIVEYFFSLRNEVLTFDSQDDAIWQLDIFVTSKVHGAVHFGHLCIPDSRRLGENAERFISIVQDGESVCADMPALRAALYRSLITPVLPYLEGVSTLYLAPDSEFCNLPFEILYADGRKPLQDDFNICRLVCGRDILFYDDQPPAGGGSFILGDPNYEAVQGRQTGAKSRGDREPLEPVEPLPFSGIEAQRIARYFRCNAVSGDAATKFALQEALPCRNIHLATHGAFDEEAEDSLYGAYLILAGYNNWVRSQTESDGCGNGVLTADEISRMDLNGTELVVLSACQSGMGGIFYGNIRGLISAFSAAGARWVVSHLWSASDFTTPILMDAFYHAHLWLGMSVPQALRHAKNYLRTVTVAQLRYDGWLDLPPDSRISPELRREIEQLRLEDPQQTPFADEFYWGGFTVHRAR